MCSYTDHNGNKIDGRIAPRSGLAAKNFIDTGAGVIDADYRGEVKVLLFNFSDVDFTGMSLELHGHFCFERICGLANSI